MKLIQQSNGISRADIAERTGLSRGGLTPIINRLMELGLITEGESVETPNGRHPVKLYLNADWLKAISILWSRDKLSIALVDANNAIQYVSHYVFNGNETSDDIFTLMYRSIGEILDSYSGKLILGIVVLGPGPLDANGGRILSPTNFHGWHDLEIVKPLKERFRLSVFLENDLVGYTLTEQQLGKIPNTDEFIMLSIGDGVGAVRISNGVIYHGSHHQVLEIGHVSLDPFGKACICGNNGCAELHASIPVLCRTALQLPPEYPITDLSATLERVVREAEMGNENCRRALEREVVYVGQIIITLINLLDVENITICGALSKTDSRFLDELNNYVRTRITARLLFQPTIRFSNVHDGRLVGGGIYVFDRFFCGKMGCYEDVIKANTDALQCWQTQCL